MRGAATTVCSCRMPPPRHSYASSPLPSPSRERRIQSPPARPKDRRSMGSSAEASLHDDAQSHPAVTGIAAECLRVCSSEGSIQVCLSASAPLHLQPRRPHAPCSPSCPLVGVVFARGNGAHPQSDDQGLSACRGSWSPSWPGPVMDAMDGYASESGRRWPSGARLRLAARCSGRSVASTVAARQRRARAPQKGGRPRRRR
jgi:hypothetical protein